MNNADKLSETLKSLGAKPSLIDEEKSKRIPPESVASNAKRGLELRKEHGRGGTGVGMRRAHQLANRSHIDDTTIKAMHSFFSRHAVDKQGKDWDKPSNGKIAHLLWGGDSGRSWAKSERNKLEKRKSED